MISNREKMVTVLGSAHFQPIADLIDRLTSTERQRPNRVKSSSNECGYTAACVLLLVAMFESYVSRVRFANGSSVPNDHRHALAVVKFLYPRLRHRKSLEDIYILRDTLTHSHLWEIEYEWGGSTPMALKSAALHPAYGDKKFAQRVNLKTHRTKALRLSVFPSRVDRTDLLKVFCTIWKTLLLFEQADRFQCYVSHLHVRFRGETVLFSSLQDELQNAL